VQVSPLAGKQLESVRLATARLNIWEGSVRSSKTISSLIAWLTFVRTGPPGNLLMAGKTERTLKRNIIDPLTEMLGPARCRLVQGSGELWLLGRRVYLAGANDERAQERIRGLTLAGCYVDEISTIPQSFWSMLLSRLSIEGARLYGTSNPDSPAHWLKAEFLDRAAVWLGQDGQVDYSEDGLDLARFSFRLSDNQHLGAAYVRSLELEFVGLWRKRFIEGLWVAAEGAVYDMFDEARHVVDVVPVIRRWLCCSVDYGTVNPLHALLIGLGVDRRLYVVSEWRWDSRARHRQLTDAEYSAKLREWLAAVKFPGSQLYGVSPERFVVDPSAASFIRQLHADHLSVMGADNAVLDGIRLVASMLGSRRLLISRSCKALISEMSSYVWDDKARLRGEDKPLKINDHGCDGLRYGLRTTHQIWRGLIIPAEKPRPYEDYFDLAQ
jgi:PBSX family phage terminase large subunit